MNSITSVVAGMENIFHFKQIIPKRKKLITTLFLILLICQLFSAETLSIVNQRNNLGGKPGQGYYIEVDIGTPPQKINVLIDTGSSNFAIAASPDPKLEYYFMRNQSSSYKEIGTSIYVPYTQGKWTGILGTDLVTTKSVNATTRANIAFIVDSSEFFINGSNWQGILGLAYSKIARPDSSVTPFFDSLVASSGCENMFSMQLCGLVYKRSNMSDVEMGGTLTFGGKDSSLYRGKLHYTPIHKEWYYDILIVDMKVDGKSLGMDCKEYNFVRTIVDSGTTNLRLPKKVFSAVVAKIKKHIQVKGVMASDLFFHGDTTVCWPTEKVPYDDFPVISMSLPVSSQQLFELRLSPQQYLRPVGELDDEGPGVDCFKFAVSDSTTGTVLGAVAMEGFYVVFDRGNKSVGFGETTCPVRKKTAVKSTILGNVKYSGDYMDCAYKKFEPDTKSLTIAGYIMAGLTSVCIIPFIIVFIRWKWQDRKLRYRAQDQTDLIQDAR